MRRWRETALADLGPPNRFGVRDMVWVGSGWVWVDVQGRVGLGLGRRARYKLTKKVCILFFCTSIMQIGVAVCTLLGPS